MITFKVLPDGGVQINLSASARIDVFEMLEMLDLDGFSLEPGDRKEKVETKFQVMAATASGNFRVR